jgi:DNA-binding response OmpR family regulator
MRDATAGMTGAAGKDVLKGARILVVEDEMMAASMLEMVLDEAGCVVVGPAPSVAEAFALVEDGPVDAAVLDVNLGGEPVYPLADALAARRVPFIFVTGDGVPGVNGARYVGVPVVQKPYDDEALVKIVANQLAAHRSTP